MKFTGKKMTLKALASIAMVVASLWSALVFGGSSDVSEQFSAANRLLFFDNHVAGAGAPVTLKYQFTKETTAEGDDGFVDQVTVAMQPAEGDRVNATVGYFTGDRKRFAPEFSNVIGNPILTIALQRDIYQMEQVLDNGIGWRHFQKRLKVAFEETASVAEVQLDIGGESVAGKEIMVKPYVNDPLARRFPKFRDKTYIFTISEKVPGAFYSIVTLVDDKESGERIRESFVFAPG